jgi:hypothetical protein
LLEHQDALGELLALVGLAAAFGLEHLQLLLENLDALLELVGIKLELEPVPRATATPRPWRRR